MTFGNHRQMQVVVTKHRDCTLAQISHEAHHLERRITTIDEVADMERIRALNVEAINTNYPDRLLALLK